MLGALNWARMNVLPNRIFGGTMENPVLVAIPDVHLHGHDAGTLRRRATTSCTRCRCSTRRVPGGLALSVTLMGTIMAATTGIIGASVVMMTLMALPVMHEPGLQHPARHRHHRRLRHARHPDPAVDHAGHHGGPDVDPRGHGLHRGGRPGLPAFRPLLRLSLHHQPPEAVSGPTLAGRGRPGCRRRLRAHAADQLRARR